MGIALPGDGKFSPTSYLPKGQAVSEGNSLLKRQGVSKRYALTTGQAVWNANSVIEYAISKDRPYQ